MHNNSGWAIQTDSWSRCRKNKRARRTTRKQTNSKRVFLLIVVRLTWLELKSAVTLIGLNVFASLEKVAMSEREQTAEMIKLQACSLRGNLTMTPLLNLACCAEKHTCPVQTLRHGPAVCPKQTSPHVLSDKLSPHSYERGREKKKVGQNKEKYGEK